MNLKTFPADASRWRDLSSVMESCSYGAKCWCAYWYRSNKDYKSGWGEGNRGHMQAMIENGAVPGLVGYSEDRPVAWVGVAPRVAYDRLERSATFTPIDKQPVWSITCFIVHNRYRRNGLMTKLAEAAAAFAFENGAPVVEAYPVADAEKRHAPDLFVGTVKAFRRAGFREVGHPTPIRRIMRLDAPVQEQAD